MVFYLVAHWYNYFIIIMLLITSNHIFVTQASSSLSTLIYKHMPDLFLQLKCHALLYYLYTTALMTDEVKVMAYTLLAYSYDVGFYNAQQYSLIIPTTAVI